LWVSRNFVTAYPKSSGICYCVSLITIVCAYLAIESAINHLECTFRSQAACSEYIKWVPDNLSQTEIDAWNKDRGHYPEMIGFWIFHPRRWSLSKDMWYDGEMVRGHRFCVGMDYPEYDDGGRCFPIEVMSGNHIGETVPYKISPDLQEEWERGNWEPCMSGKWNECFHPDQTPPVLRQ
jgi:hypothetical protein